jgi:hypothetical protein
MSVKSIVCWTVYAPIVIIVMVLGIIVSNAIPLAIGYAFLAALGVL